MRFSMKDQEALESAVREAVLIKRMSHPHVVQTYAWTVLSARDVGIPVRIPHPSICSRYSMHTFGWGLGEHKPIAWQQGTPGMLSRQLM